MSLTPEKSKGSDSPRSHLNVLLPDWIIQDLKRMEQNTQKPVDELVKTALMMFIATHNDYLGVKPKSK